MSKNLSSKSQPISGAPEKPRTARKQRHSSVSVQTSQATARETELDREAIARLAYALWEERGYPPCSAEQDWLEAEEQLRTTAAVK